MMKRISVFITLLSICSLFMHLTVSAQTAAGEAAAGEVGTAQAGVAQAEVTETDSTVTIHRIELIDNSVLIGSILFEDSTTVLFKTISGIEIGIPRDKIESHEIITGQLVRGKLWRKDPNTTRLLFAPTARPLRKGQGYFAAYEIFFPMIAYGITDFFTLAGGMTLIPGAPEQLFYIAPKLTFLREEKFDLSAGILYGNLIGGGEGGGIAYGVGTYGSDRQALTFGLGYGFSGGDFANNPVLLIGGELQSSKSTKLITENWIIMGEDIVIYSLGMRFFGENLAADFGFIGVNRETSGFPLMPWVGFAYNFDNK